LIGIEGAAAEDMNSTCATVATGTVHREAAVRAREEARVWALGTPAAGLCPRPAREKRFFLLISCLIRLIHLLSLYREVYLTYKQDLLDP